MSVIKFIFLLFAISIFTSCKDETVLPKPKSFLSLEYPKAEYQTSLTNLYKLETNKKATVLVNKKDWMIIKYPKLKASINITYRPVENNLKELFNEANKLTIKHASKADAIYSDEYEDPTERVYGKLNNVTGNAASSIQFHVTDSVSHFLIGSLYFEAQPNYDSIYPAIRYIEKDIKHLMSTTEWRN